MAQIKSKVEQPSFAPNPAIMFDQQNDMAMAQENVSNYAGQPAIHVPVNHYKAGKPKLAKPIAK